MTQAQCPNGHKFEDSPYDQIRERECPECGVRWTTGIDNSTNMCESWISDEAQCNESPASSSPTNVMLCQKHGEKSYGKCWNVYGDMRFLNSPYEHLGGPYGSVF